MKKNLSVLYKVLIIIISGIGLFLNLKFYSNLASILYFTIISNICCFVFYLIAFLLFLFKKLKKNNLYYIFKGMVTICITLTFFIYLFLLKDTELFKGHFLENLFTHILTPLMVISDYIIFGEKGNLKKEFVLKWSLSILFYTLICEIFITLGGTFEGNKYPYYYMDVDTYGPVRVILNCMVIYIGFMLYGYLVCFLDKLVANKIKKIKEK